MVFALGFGLTVGSVRALEPTNKIPTAVESYTLKPSEKVVNTYIQPQGYFYGVNVKLYNQNHQLVKDQADFYYQWSVMANPHQNYAIVYVTDYGMKNGCPYDIKAPCPNLHADLRAVHLGQARIQVEAYKLNRLVARTSFIVNVTDQWQLHWRNKHSVIEQGIDYPFSLELRLNDRPIKNLDQVHFRWRQNESTPKLWIRDTLVDYDRNYCGSDYPCPNSNVDATIRGLSLGKTILSVTAETKDGYKLGRTIDLPITIVPRRPISPRPTTLPIAVNRPVFPVENKPTLPPEIRLPKPINNWEGEKEQQINARLKRLETTIAMQKKSLVKQQQLIKQTEQRLNQQQNVLKIIQIQINKISLFFQKIFNFRLAN